MFDSLHNKEETTTEKITRLRNNIGIVLCSIQKNGIYNSPESQIDLARGLSSPAIQFDFRERTLKEIGHFATLLLDYRNENPHLSLSIHGDTPDFDESNLTIKNYERVREELRFVQDIAGESYTAHPPFIKSNIFKNLTPQFQNTIIENYTQVFIEAIKEAISHENKFSISIENMPHEGTNGLFGQTMEELILLIGKIREDLQHHGISADLAHEYIGIAFDINHALNDVETVDYRLVLRRWLRGLGGNVKVVYLNTPTNITDAFINRYNLTLELTARYCPHARILLKSKKDSDITSRIFKVVKEMGDEDIG